MGTPQPTGNDGQPADNQVCGHQTVRFHGNRCPIETPVPLLPVLITQKQGSDHSPHCVLKIRNQLNRQQREGGLSLSAQKPGDGNPFLFKLRKQLDGISKVWGNLPIAFYLTADGTLMTNNGEEINMARKIGFFIFEYRFKSVIVG